MHAPRGAPAQRTVAIVDHSLGNCAEHEFTHALEADGKWKQHRSNARAHEIGKSPACSRKTEHAIGRRDEPPRKSDSFGLIAVEQRAVGVARQNRGKFPGEIDGVPDAGVHTLATRRTVNVRSIADEK